MIDTLEEDFRAWLAADGTPITGVAALVGINVYFTGIPTKIDGGFIGLRCGRKDGVQTTDIGGGKLTLARLTAACCFKGPDPVLNYVNAKQIAQAVKSRVNTANGTWVMGHTTIYFISIDESIEEGQGDAAQGDAERDDKFDFHAGMSSGIQHVDVAVAFHYWSPNS